MVLCGVYSQHVCAGFLGGDWLQSPATDFKTSSSPLLVIISRHVVMCFVAQHIVNCINSISEHPGDSRICCVVLLDPL